MFENANGHLADDLETSLNETLLFKCMQFMFDRWNEIEYATLMATHQLLDITLKGFKTFPNKRFSNAFMHVEIPSFRHHLRRFIV